MGFIPQSFIEELLARIDIVDVINARVPLRKSGRNYMACCPFHQEKSPSFSVVPDKQFYNCFGCGAAGSALKFVMSYDNLEFKDAVEKLAAEVGLELPEVKGNEQQNNSYKLYYDLLEKTAGYYQRGIFKNNQAMQYLDKRGIDLDIAKFFKLGYVSNAWDNLTKFFKNYSGMNSDFNLEQTLEKVGLWIEKEDKSGGYDRFRNRLMFPIRDLKGRVIAFGGRVLDDSKPKYLNSPETSLFHKSSELYGLYEAITVNHQNKTKLNKFIIVEGYLDVISLFQHGINYAVATLGTASSYRHLAKLFKYCQEVIYCFDGDEAGEKAAWRALENSLPALYPGRVIKFLFLPESHDPDTYVRQFGKQEFEQQIHDAVSLTDYLFTQQMKILGISDLINVEDKVSFIKLCKPLINKLPEGDYKVLLENELARRCNLTLDSINKIFINDNSNEYVVASSSINQNRVRHVSASKSPKLSIWRRACLLLVHNPKFINLIPAQFIQSLASIQDNKSATLFYYLYQEIIINVDDRNNDACTDEKVNLVQGLTIPEVIDNLINKSKTEVLYAKLKNIIVDLLATDPMVEDEFAKSEFIDLLLRLEHELSQHEMDILKHKVATLGMSSLSLEEKNKLQKLLLSS